MCLFFRSFGQSLCEVKLPERLKVLYRAVGRRSGPGTRRDDRENVTAGPPSINNQ